MTQTYGDDANNDGFLQVSEIPLDGSGGSDFLDTSPYETTYNYDVNIDQEITQEIVIGVGELTYGEGESGRAQIYDNYAIDPTYEAGQTVSGNGVLFTIEQEIEQPVYSYDAFNDYNTDLGNPSVDDNGATDLGNNLVVNSIDESGGPLDGFIEVTYDFQYTFDQDIVQDVFYEIDLIQDFTQEVDINQTYTIYETRTETRTRLAGE